VSLLVTHALDVEGAQQELDRLRAFLSSFAFFKERPVVRLLKGSPNLTVLAGVLGRGMILADAFKYEFVIQGVVAADLVLRSRGGRVVFIEFEGGSEDSIFARKSTNQLRGWSREIEHATGQIIDWSWALADANNSTLLENNLGIRPVDIQYLVVCGRDSGLDSDLLRHRFAYRHSRLNIAGNSVVFLTYDGFVQEMSHALSELRAEGVRPRDRRP
jgi:hypothetical protein